jgi:hypothetical protein
MRLHDWHGREMEATNALAAGLQLILANEALLTISRPLELALFMGAKLMCPSYEWRPPTFQPLATESRARTDNASREARSQRRSI